jgi:hypothetical protein
MTLTVQMHREIAATLDNIEKGLRRVGELIYEGRGPSNAYREVERLRGGVRDLREILLAVVVRDHPSEDGIEVYEHEGLGADTEGCPQCARRALEARAESYWEKHTAMLGRLHFGKPGELEDVEVWEISELAAALKAKHDRLLDQAQTLCAK